MGFEDTKTVIVLVPEQLKAPARARRKGGRHAIRVLATAILKANIYM